MKAISILKICTAVSFLITGTGNFVFASEDGETKQECMRRVKSSGSVYRSRAESECNGRTMIIEGGVSTPLVKGSPQYQSCVNSELVILAKDECDDFESTKDIKNKCEESLKSYYEASKKATSECSLIKNSGSSAAECRETASRCAKGLNSFADDDSGTAVGNIFGIMQSAYGSNQNDYSGYDGCLMENDDKAAEKEATVDDKITKLREEITDLKEDATKADHELTEKRNEVEKEINEAEAEFEKDKFEKQKSNADRIAQIQKMVLASQKKRRDNDRRIVEKHIEVANLSFAQQKLNIELADVTITRTCKEVANTMLSKVKNKLDSQTGKMTSLRYSLSEAQQIKKDIKLAQLNCLQNKALEKQAAIKSIIDNRRKLQADIASLEASSADEAKAIENELKNMEDLKAIAAEEEKKSLEAKLKKMNNLNQSVTDMEKFVENKKKSYGEKAKAKEDRINKLIIDRQNFKSRFAKVTEAAKESGDKASSYLDLCCKNSDKSKNHKSCGRVINLEEGDNITDGAREYKKSGSGTKR